MRATLGHLLGAMHAGRLARQEVLEEIERHLDRGPEGPVEGVLELVLEELYRTPWDPHLLRILARIHERDGDVDGAQRAMEVARHAGAGDSGARAEVDDLADDGASVDDLLLVARLLLSTRAVEQASDVAERAVQAAPNSLAALNLLAKIRHVQGRLSEMIELWQRIHQSSPTRETALMQLELIYQMSHDAKLVGKRHYAIGYDVFAPKHDVQVEIERAFACFRAQDFTEALAICDRTIARRDAMAPELYKLAVFQRAWICERTGELESARTTLEKLGKERGFETDLERLMFLARICEQIGTPASTRKALHIYQHVNLQYGKLSVLPRLTALHRHRKEHDAAKRYAKEYERRFTQRMQRLTPSQLLRALALAYVPLDRVEVPAQGPDDHAACELELRLARTDVGRKRREGLWAFLRGDVARAEQAIRELADADDAGFKDCAYAADLLRLRDEPAANRYYARALARGGAASFVLWQQFLAATEGDERARESAVSTLGGAGIEVARAALFEAARRAPSQPPAWSALALVERVAERDDEHRRFRAKAESLLRVDVLAPSIGRALAAAAYRLGGKPKGVIHEVVASRRRTTIPGSGGAIADSDLLGNLGPDLRALIHLALSITKDYARAKWPHLLHDVDEYAYALRVSKDDEPSNGNSAGLPIAVALLSTLLQRPIPPDFAFSGAISGDAHGSVAVLRVGDAPYKVKGAFHRDLATIVLPRGNQVDVESATIIPEQTRAKMVRFVRTLDDAIEAVWGPQAWTW